MAFYSHQPSGQSLLLSPVVYRWVYITELLSYQEQNGNTRCLMERERSRVVMNVDITEDICTLLIAILSITCPLSLSLPPSLASSLTIPQGAEVSYSPAASCPWTAVCVRFHWAPASRSWSRGWWFQDCSPRPSPLRGAGGKKGQPGRGQTGS